MFPIDPGSSEGPGFFRGTRVLQRDPGSSGSCGQCQVQLNASALLTFVHVAPSKEVKTVPGGGPGGPRGGPASHRAGPGGHRGGPGGPEGHRGGWLRSCSDGRIYGRRNTSASSSSPVLSNPKSVLQRPVSTDELQTPGGPYIKKTFTIVGDAVGWGFVVRGNRPCHIQAVEPRGPAAAAGMKVCQFVVSVNGLNVLHLDYRTVSRLILTGPRTVVMEVMEETKH
ncbi:DEP domain-containing mTOR-interacting protein-like [Sphaeramia orbicularis]|uniref:DEP domain-containing mTOR-interacting protein-like n=1 Tax=Sphaeramia orbicularis TaxID=375764 RepID=UPI00117C7ABD|nr:DEP domain-containing mTOR-interacting protein-like [Sphaeramia orbicularis]